MRPYLDYEQRVLDLVKEQSTTVTLGSVLNRRLVFGGVRGSGGGTGGPIQPFIGKLPQTKVTFDESELAVTTIPSGEIASLLDNLNRIRAGETIVPQHVPINYTTSAPGNLNDHLEGIDGALASGVVASGGGHTIQDEGINLPQRAKLNFVGSAVQATDDAGNNATIVTISGGVSSEGDEFFWWGW